MKQLWLVALLLMMAGCDTVSTNTRPSTYHTPPKAPTPTLFQGAKSNLSNSAIGKALDYQLKFPKQMRIAVIQMSDISDFGDYDFNQQHDYGDLTDNYAQFFKILEQSPQVYDASFFPPMLMPAKKTIDSLRSAAARYQADELLLYRNHCRLDNKYHIVAPNEVQATCTIEAVMIDVRSGLVAFSSVSNQQLHAAKKKSDFDFDATVEKARTRAIGDGLDEIGKDLVKFLGNAPKM